MKKWNDVQFAIYQEEGGPLSREEWEKEDPEATSRSRGSNALDVLHKKIKAHALKMSLSENQSYVKLFNQAKVGFNLEKAGSKGKRDSRDQSRMRRLMLREYCNNSQGAVWDPVLGTWIDNDAATAAHLFPWVSADFMDDIFGAGAQDELFTPANGLFLQTKLEKAFDRGFFVIIPDAEIEPKNLEAPWEDREERHQAVSEWQSKHPHEYRVKVLDATAKCMTDRVFSKHLHGIETIAELDGRRLKFLTNTRPRARYLWWTFLRAVTQLTWNSNLKEDSFIHKEVLAGTRYWGTPGKYVKSNKLLGFIEEIGHDVSHISDTDPIAKSIMEHAIEEEGNPNAEPDPTGVMIVASEAVRRAREDDGYDYERELAYLSEEEDRVRQARKDAGYDDETDEDGDKDEDEEV